MNNSLSLLIIAFVITAVSACTSEQFSRNVYEGARVRNESLKSTPLEQSKGGLPSYDQYEKERRGGVTGQSE
jgi:hypothetical protein